MCREHKIEELASRALQRRTLRHLLAAIQQYLGKADQRKQAESFCQRLVKRRGMREWRRHALLAARTRVLLGRRAREALKSALQVG